MPNTAARVIERPPLRVPVTIKRQQRRSSMSRVHAHLAAPGAVSRRAAGWALTVIRWASGAVFVAFGAGKFVNHSSEASSFQTYGLPWPSLFTDAVGALELVGGVLLVVGLATRLVGPLLAGDMIGAIVVSGLIRGEIISLTLAPVMLVAMGVLVALGPGRLSLDAPLLARRPRPHPLDGFSPRRRLRDASKAGLVQPPTQAGDSEEDETLLRHQDTGSAASTAR
jgi:putative oxidoreductase